MDHFMDEHPIVFGCGDLGIAANADQDKAAISGISYTMAYAGTVSAAHSQAEVRNREASVIVARDGGGRRFHPAQQLLPRQLHWGIRQGNFDGGATQPSGSHCLTLMSWPRMAAGRQEVSSSKRNESSRDDEIAWIYRVPLCLHWVAAAGLRMRFFHQAATSVSSANLPGPNDQESAMRYQQDWEWSQLQRTFRVRKEDGLKASESAVI